jgi:hypothetical protein
MLLAVVCAAPLLAEEPPRPTATPSTPEADVFQLPFLFDGVYQMRVHEDRGWHGMDAMFRLRPDQWFDNPDIRQHQLVLAGFWETGYRHDPNPTRFAVMAGYGWGADFVHSQREGEDSFLSLSDRGAFPLTRSGFFSSAFQVMVGFHSSRGTRGPDGKFESQDAIRFEHRVAGGALWFEFMASAAVNLNLRDGRFLDREVFVGIELARPIAPFGIRVGYSYMFFERAGFAHFVFGLHVAF